MRCDGVSPSAFVATKVGCELQSFCSIGIGAGNPRTAAGCCC